MGELRTSPVTGETVAVAPRRGGRPADQEGAAAAFGPAAGAGSCPFCPGNESRLSEILWEERAPGESGWRLRAVPNRYPAFGPSDAAAGEGRPAEGRQEVLVETPHHGRDPSRMGRSELGRVLRGYEGRFRAVSKGPGVQRVFLFRNHGPEAGASLAHPHAQIVGTDSVPPKQARLERRLRRGGRERGGCLLCELPGLEPEWDERLVEETTGFRAFVPWAASAPYEVWIVPRRHSSAFGLAGTDEVHDLAGLLGALLRIYREDLGELPYNLLFRTGPPAVGDDPFLHWWIQLRPRVGQPAGFELGAGVWINPSAPEEDSGVLRSALSLRKRTGEGPDQEGEVGRGRASSPSGGTDTSPAEEKPRA